MAKTLGLGPGVPPRTASVLESRLGAYTEVGPRTSLLETTMSDHSYIASDGEVAYATIGRFCSIASHARLNPGNHPMRRASQAHSTYRASAYWPEQEEDEAAFFDRRRSASVTLGTKSGSATASWCCRGAASARARWSGPAPS